MGRIVVVGASGLIGAHVAAELAQRGHEVVGVARHVREWQVRMPSIRWAELDMGRAGVADWTPLLSGSCALVNCAGALQDGPADDVAKVHDTGLRRLLAACEAASVGRFIQISAMGVDQATPTAFSRSKRAGDEAVMVSRLDSVILRPSLVLAASVYGGSALIRGLAALPVLPVMPATGPLRPVVLEDLVATVLRFLEPDAPTGVVLDVSGPEAFSFVELVRLYRQWLGFRPAREIRLPPWLAAALYRLGDFAGWLGWRPPVRSTARLEIARGAAADGAEWMRVSGIVPARLRDVLQARPASVQDRWFAGLYLTKPVILGSLSIFWVGSGLASLGPGQAWGVATMQQAGAGDLAPVAVIGGGIADLLIGIGIAVRRTARPALIAAGAVSVAYAAAGTVFTPWLWLDPLAALLKIAPRLALTVVALVTLRDR